MHGKIGKEHSGNFQGVRCERRNCQIWWKIKNMDGDVMNLRKALSLKGSFSSLSEMETASFIGRLNPHLADYIHLLRRDRIFFLNGRFNTAPRTLDSINDDHQGGIRPNRSKGYSRRIIRRWIWTPESRWEHFPKKLVFAWWRLSSHFFTRRTSESPDRVQTPGRITLVFLFVSKTYPRFSWLGCSLSEEEERIFMVAVTGDLHIRVSPNLLQDN